MCLALLTIRFTEFWYLSVGSCFSSVMFCSMKFCTFLCRLSVGIIKNDILNEQTQFISHVLFEHITPVSYTHLDVYKRQDI